MIKCPKCKRNVTVQSEFPLGNLINYVYTCGHLELRSKLESNKEINEPQIKVEFPIPDPPDYPNASHIDTWFNWIGKDNTFKPLPHESYYSIDGKDCSYPYQIDGVTFAEGNYLNVIFADAMGVGKTIESLVTIKRNKVIAQPCLAIVPGGIVFQWAEKFQHWVNGQFGSMMPITKRGHIIPGFDFYIISMDLLARKGVLELLLPLNIKCVILDECQKFKESSTGRTEALINFIKLAKIQYLLSLSGTPIKNRFIEYKTIICKIHKLMSEAEFETYLAYNEKGQKVKLNPLYIDKFKERTKSFIIRRERCDVLLDLPPLTRDYQIIEIDDINIRNTYNRTIDLFKNWLNDNKSGVTSQNVLGWLAQIRAITGQAKCKNAIEWTRDFLESTDESIAIGIQHISVRDTLYYIFEQNGLRPLKFSGEDSMYTKNDIVRRFTNGQNRLLVINAIAGGVGLNLQTCANALVLERQWNSADEEQFEARFHRDGQQKAVTITYMIAKGTIDEFFHEMVQKKRKDLSNAGIGFAEGDEAQLDSLLEFAQQVVGHKI